MKKVISFFCFILLTSAISFAQNTAAEIVAGATSKIPAAKVKTLNNKSFSTADLSNDGKPMIISFWATWCKPCILELNAIQGIYDKLHEETGVKLVAISIDDVRTVEEVAPFVESMEWPYEVYTDENSDFKRAMNVVNVPHTFLVNGKGEIVSQHTSYAPGDEHKLMEEVRKLAKEGKVEIQDEEKK